MWSEIQGMFVFPSAVYPLCTMFKGRDMIHDKSGKEVAEMFQGIYNSRQKNLHMGFIL